MGARAVSGHIGVFPQVVYAVIDDGPLGPTSRSVTRVEAFVRREDDRAVHRGSAATILSSRRSWGSKSRS